MCLIANMMNKSLNNSAANRLSAAGWGCLCALKSEQG